MRQQTKHMVRVFWTGDATGGYEFDDEDSAWYQVRDRITDTFNVGRLSDAINYEDVTVRGVVRQHQGFSLVPVVDHVRWKADHWR